VRRDAILRAILAPPDPAQYLIRHNGPLYPLYPRGPLEEEQPCYYTGSTVGQRSSGRRQGDDRAHGVILSIVILYSPSIYHSFFFAIFVDGWSSSVTSFPPTVNQLP
jgi:hypothetical protein